MMEPFPATVFPMPKISQTIPNDLLFAHLGDRQKLSDSVWLLPQQVALLLGRSVDQLGDDRKRDLPPPFFKPNGDGGTVRYLLGSVRDDMDRRASGAKVREERARAERETAIRARSLDEFVLNAAMDEAWAFTTDTTPEGDEVTMDFFKSIGQPLTNEARCLVMSFWEFCEERRAQQQANEVRREKREAKEALLKARKGEPFTDPKPPARH